MSSDEAHLRETFAIARRALLRGNRPFGALLVARNGAVLAAAENTQMTGEQVLAHAEMNLLYRAARDLTTDVLSAATLYTSAEPCAMCAGAIFWSGVGRVVYGLSGDRLHELSGYDPHILVPNAREVLSRAGRRVEIIGPMLENEAAGLFTDDVL
jgi:tRNA(Arg) A34 adenosine deaminase TadA